MDLYQKDLDPPGKFVKDPKPCLWLRAHTNIVQILHRILQIYFHICCSHMANTKKVHYYISYFNISVGRSISMNFCLASNYCTFSFSSSLLFFRRKEKGKKKNQFVAVYTWLSYICSSKNSHKKNVPVLPVLRGFHKILLSICHTLVLKWCIFYTWFDKSINSYGRLKVSVVLVECLMSHCIIWILNTKSESDLFLYIRNLKNKHCCVLWIHRCYSVFKKLILKNLSIYLVYLYNQTCTGSWIVQEQDMYQTRSRSQQSFGQL